MKPGKETTEYWKAFRVELAGYVVAVAGLTIAILGAFQGAVIGASVGVALAAVGAFLVGKSMAYVDGRSDIKAAGLRPHVAKASGPI